MRTLLRRCHRYGVPPGGAAARYHRLVEGGCRVAGAWLHGGTPFRFRRRCSASKAKAATPFAARASSLREAGHPLLRALAEGLREGGKARLRTLGLDDRFSSARKPALRSLGRRLGRGARLRATAALMPPLGSMALARYASCACSAGRGRFTRCPAVGGALTRAPFRPSAFSPP